VTWCAGRSYAHAALACDGFEHPPREVGRTHVATAQDRGDAPPGEPLRFLEDGGDPKRCGRLDDESRVLIKHVHAGELAHRCNTLRE
jgi:hypothetical protein